MFFKAEGEGEMEEEIDLRECLKIIDKRWKLIIILPLIAAITSGLVSFYCIRPVFQTSTTMIIGKKTPDQGQTIGQIISLDVLLANQQLNKTYETIAKSQTVEQNVINDLHLPLTIGELNNLISVTPVQDTEIMKISAVSTNPEMAALIANTVAEEFSKTVINVGKVDTVSIVDKALTPVSPIRPNKILNILIAFIVGLVVSVVLAFLLDYLKENVDTTSKKASDLEKLLGMPVLGIIPNYQIGKHG